MEGPGRPNRRVVPKEPLARRIIGAAARPILLPLALYAGLCTLVLLGWPGTKSRYAMPAAPAIAVMAGIAIDPLWRRRHWAAAAALATVVVLFLGQVALVVAVRPFYADYYSKKRNFAAAINASGLVPYSNFALNFRVFAWGVGLSLVFAVLSGVLPAWRMSRLDPVAALSGRSL